MMIFVEQTLEHIIHNSLLPSWDHIKPGLHSIRLGLAHSLHPPPSMVGLAEPHCCGKLPKPLSSFSGWFPFRLTGF